MAKMQRTATTAERLRQALDASGKKQAELAREAEVDKGALSSYLSGKYEPKQKAISRLAAVLDVSEMWLWGYDVPRDRSPEQKKNDRLVSVVKQLRADPEFSEVVSMLAELPADQYGSIKALILALRNK